MSDDKPPKNWWEFASTWTWGGLVFTCAFVFIEKLVEQNYGQALAALILGLGIAAVALHSKTWLDKTNPNWAFAVGVLLLMAIIFSPFVEEKRWPFGAWLQPIPTVIHDAPTAEDIVKATAPLQADLDAAKRQIATLQVDVRAATAATEDARREAQTAKERNAVPQTQTIPSPASSVEESHSGLTPDEITENLDIWRSLDIQMTDFSKILTEWYSILDIWKSDVNYDRDNLNTLMDAADYGTFSATTKLRGLRDSSLKYQDIAKTISSSVINDLPNSIFNFERAIRGLPRSLPDNYETLVTPYVSSLRKELDAARDWQSATQRTARTKIRELSNAGARK